MGEGKEQEGAPTVRVDSAYGGPGEANKGRMLSLNEDIWMSMEAYIKLTRPNPKETKRATLLELPASTKIVEE